MGGVENLTATVFALRLVNLLFTAIAISFFIAAFRLLMPLGPAAYWGAALLAVHPLLLLTGVRVANDALSMLAAGAVVYWTARVMRATVGQERWQWRLPVVLGCVLGLALWTKPTIVALVPIALAAPLGVGWKTGCSATMRRRIATSAIVGALFVAITFPYFYRNLRLYHSLLPIIEAITDGGIKKTSDYLAAATHIAWGTELRLWWLQGSLWVGGWSFLEIPKWIRAALFEPLMVAGLALAGYRGVRAFRAGRSGRDGVLRGVLFSVAVCGLFTAALSLHAIKTQMFVGKPMTCQWYAAGAWPLELLLVAIGFSAVRQRWAGKVLCCGLISTCVIAEFYGTLLRMPKFYGATSIRSVAFQRLAELRPWVFGEGTLIVLAGVYVLMAGALLWSVAAAKEYVEPIPNGRH